MSQTLVQRPTHVHNFPSSREIIDVDDLVPGSTHVHIDDDDIQLIEARPSRGSNRLSHEPIVIADSDDDIEIVSGPSRPRPPHNGRPERNQRDSPFSFVFVSLMLIDYIRNSPAEPPNAVLSLSATAGQLRASSAPSASSASFSRSRTRSTTASL